MNSAKHKGILFLVYLAVFQFPNLLSAQLSYQQSRPLRIEPRISKTRAQAEQPDFHPRPRFRGWKHTANARENLSSPGAASSPTTPEIAQSMVHPVAPTVRNPTVFEQLCSSPHVACGTDTDGSRGSRLQRRWQAGLGFLEWR